MSCERWLSVLECTAASFWDSRRTAMLSLRIEVKQRHVCQERRLSSVPDNRTFGQTTRLTPVKDELVKDGALNCEGCALHSCKVQGCEGGNERQRYSPARSIYVYNSLADCASPMLPPLYGPLFREPLS